MGKKILTLNIGASGVALAEYEVGGRRAKLLKYGTATLAAPLDAVNAGTVLTPALLEIVREKGIRPGRVAVAVSGQMVFPRIAAIPMAGGGDRFEQQVRYEIEQNIPFPIDEMVCDRQILGETPSGDKSVLIVAAKIEQVEAVTDALRAAGFTPEIVGVAPFAVTNVLLAGTADDPSCKVLLDIGAKTTSLVIVEGERLYNRSIPVAGNTITKEIAQALACSPEEAERIKCESAYVSMGGVTEDEDETLDRISKVCRAVLTRLHAEISRSINFYRSQQNGSAPARLYLTGGTSVIPQLAEFFQDSLGIEVAYLDPFTGVAIDPAVDETALASDGAVLAATAGLALQAAGGASLNLNLLPPSILAARAERARIPFVAVGAALAVLGPALWFLSVKGVSDAVVTRLPGVTSRAAAAQRQMKAVRDARDAERTARADADRLAALMVRRTSALRRLALVRRAIGETLWIAKWDETMRPPLQQENREPEYGDTEVRPLLTATVTIRGWETDVAEFLRPFEGKTAQEVVKDKLLAARFGVRTCCAAVDSGKSTAYGLNAQMRPLQEFTVTIQFNEEETACN